MKNKIETIIHIIIVISTFWSISLYFIGEPGSMGLTGAECFNYFTTDSNVLAMIASALCLIYPAGEHRPRFVSIIRFAGTVAVSVTLLTVIFFLAPTAAMNGGTDAALAFFLGNIFVLHLSTPVLSIAAFLMSDDSLSKKDIIWPVVPVLIYSVLYAVMVIYLEKWVDWYGFTFGGHNNLAPIVMAVMYIFAAMLALAELKLRDRLHR